ncbi:hypothetical protein TNCV_119711 [Trichonephila clavipes]|nr:hypothetical protein TNCV_119711 [Trichonephila clavipes]
MWVGLPGSELVGRTWQGGVATETNFLAYGFGGKVLDSLNGTALVGGTVKDDGHHQVSYFFREVILESRSENISFLIIAVSNAGRTNLQQRFSVDGIIFMQDDTPQHIANPMKQLLKGQFGNSRISSRHLPTAWPPDHLILIRVTSGCGAS